MSAQHAAAATGVASARAAAAAPHPGAYDPPGAAIDEAGSSLVDSKNSVRMDATGVKQLQVVPVAAGVTTGTAQLMHSSGAAGVCCAGWHGVAGPGSLTCPALEGYLL